MYDLGAILTRLKFPISTTLAGWSFHSRIILLKNWVTEWRAHLLTARDGL